MEKTQYLIIGGGITGLSFANFLPESADWLLIEQCPGPGGHCRTVKQDGFVWDYCGHFLHFRHPEIRQFLMDRMAGVEVLTIKRRSSIQFKGSRIDFPFQKNIHQLPKEDFIECLYDLYFCQGSTKEAGSFEEMLLTRYGRGIAEKFLIPYNEKLYASSLSALDQDAMGRFFPAADIGDVIRNMRFPEDGSYNSSFLYPRGGAVEYVGALVRNIDPLRICCNERLMQLDVQRKLARTNRRVIAFDYLISSAPFPNLLRAATIPFDEMLYRHNQVLVFNLGFDRDSTVQDHWIYFPERNKCFYRVGFYNNIQETERMSLYVEIGLPADAKIATEAWLKQVLQDLQACGIITDQRLLSWHSVALNPAYVHINRRSQNDVASRRQDLSGCGIYSIGRYGGWTYTSIEDNIVEARDLARQLCEPNS